MLCIINRIISRGNSQKKNNIESRLWNGCKFITHEIQLLLVQMILHCIERSAKQREWFSSSFLMYNY